MITSQSQNCSVKLPTYLGFAILGFVNATLPLIVFSANHLAVRYPRCVVILIETLPALVTKLCLPHFLHRVPYWMRPLSAGAIWILVAISIKTTPTNIAAPPRVFTSILASSATAAIDVSFLGMTRYYGRVGLAGWGAGVGAGTLSCAALAFILARGMGAVVPCLVGCIYALVGAMLFAFFVVLPGAPAHYPETRQSCRREPDIEDSQWDASLGLLTSGPLLSADGGLDLVHSIARDSMAPLMIAFTIQTIIFPSITRVFQTPFSPESCFSFFATYGCAFQLGNFMSRVLTPLVQFHGTDFAFSFLSLATAVLIANVGFSLFTSPVLVGLLAWCIGAVGGAIWTIILDNVRGRNSLNPDINLEFRLQVVGSGETAGTIVGGVLGVLLEESICRSDAAVRINAILIRWSRPNGLPAIVDKNTGTGLF